MFVQDRCRSFDTGKRIGVDGQVSLLGEPRETTVVVVSSGVMATKDDGLLGRGLSDHVCPSEFDGLITTGNMKWSQSSPRIPSRPCPRFFARLPLRWHLSTCELVWPGDVRKLWIGRRDSIFNLLTHTTISSSVTANLRSRIHHGNGKT